MHGEMEMLLVGWWGCVMFALSCTIFVSYQVIPSALEAIEGHGRLNPHEASYLIAVTSSKVFRSFIRVCGFNHPIMSGVMMATANGWIMASDFWRGLLIAGEGLVALVSVLSALAVWRVKWYLSAH